ncbi:MAG: hemin uptake protein HemP [Burkholderiaceae bacterium]|nr:hemin uptake protein HemP [Burkholderiaceae bacterium]
MSTEPPNPATLATPPPASAELTPPPVRWTSDILLAGAREVQIEHQGCTYRLRLTQLGKLILTK